ncbi:hypothetical protein [Negativicoccus succinicivorans]|uniref:hypothetical protein n=1 Tax=Negativicoccus succinicivorans TaxID=620903 RepID=UPI00290830D6|nr:hypothetical protein [Negativicoccus succinicivorans]MDU5287766.1 hypothetical protein [Negativicoccus succinicivorans]
MIKKLVGFLTVLCMAFFIAGCSSTPDMSGTYMLFNSDNNEPSNAIVISHVSDNVYEYTRYFVGAQSHKMVEMEKRRVIFKPEEKILQSQSDPFYKLFLNKDYTVITTIGRSISGANKEFNYKKLSDSEIKQYQHLFE